jgi:hypothetical protein
LSLKKD